MSFKNKVVVVTGGFEGTGKVIANKFRNQKAKVYSLDNKYVRNKKIKNFTTYKIDLSNFNEIQKRMIENGKATDRLSNLKKVNVETIKMHIGEKKGMIELLHFHSHKRKKKIINITYQKLEFHILQ